MSEFSYRNEEVMGWGKEVQTVGSFEGTLPGFHHTTEKGPALSPSPCMPLQLAHHHLPAEPPPWDT